MKNHELVVRIRDDERLAELEKVIAKGRKTFVEVGRALAEIRDTRLYRREYSGFEEYCQKKWGWTRQRAYQLMDAAEVQMSTAVDISSERAARELGRVPTEQRAQIVQAIAAEGQPVTAPAVKRHLPPPPMRRRAPGGEPAQIPAVDGEPLTQNVGTAVPTFGEGSNGTAGEEASTTTAPPPPPPPPGQVLDATGWPIPTQLIPLWQRAGEVQEWLTVLSRLKGVLRSAQENRDMLFAEVQFSSALSQAEQLWTDMKTAKPFAVCPTCQGQVPDKCTLCRGRGLISEFRWNTCVTREDKEFRARAKQKSSSGKARP
jgi:hypothetical protein